MITANNILDITTSDESPIPSLRYGTVKSIVGGRPMIQFDGESIPSQKEYRKLASYTPAVSDRVALIPTAGTHLILGKVD